MSLAVLALGSFAAVSYFKIIRSTSTALINFDPQKDTGYYWSESAFQYRYARMVALGQAIPSLDVDAEFPDGVDTSRELTMLMERTTGKAYRWFNSFYELPFHVFVIYFYSLFSSLSVLAFCWAAVQIGGPTPWAAVITMAYAFTPASWARFVGNYVYEGFALPWLFLGFASFMAALKAPQAKPARIAAFAALAGLSLCIGLLSWHFARFYLTVFMAAAAIHYFYNYERTESLDALILALGVVLGFCLMGGALSTVLRANGFLASPAILIGSSIWVSHWLRRRFSLARSRWAWVFLGVAASAWLGVAILSAGDASGYGHVYSLFTAKMTHLLKKPADPSVLDFEARALWVDPFNSPAPGHIFYYLFPLALPLIVSPFLGSKEPSAGSWLCPLTYGMFAASACLYMLIERLAGLAVFFLGLCVLHALDGRKSGRRAMTALLLIVMVAELGKAAPWGPQGGFLFQIVRQLTFKSKEALGQIEHVNGLIDWIASRTREQDKILAGIGVSPSLLAYANRAIILQPKFESFKTRKKYKEFLGALYGGEDQLFDFCQKNRADYLVFQSSFALDDGPDGERYTADALALPPSSAAFLLHFKPEALKRFRLVYQNMSFRVFYIARDGRPGPGHGFIAYKDPVYSLEEFIGDGPIRPLRPGDSRMLVRKLSQRRAYLQRAQKERDAGRLSQAEALFLSVLRMLPADAETWQDLGQMKAAQKEYAAAELALKRAAESNPNLLISQKLLSDLYLRSSRMDAALPVLQRIVELDPRYAAAHSNLGVVYLKRNELRKSLASFEMAHRLDPDDPEIARNRRLVSELVSRRSGRDK